ncbi:MAG: hypothetical protein QME42_02365 [bacterium]|nr:hypothetical protein [bacterium]
MAEIGVITNVFGIFTLGLLILAYANPRLDQRPNKTFLLLALLMGLLWAALFFVFEPTRGGILK